MNWQDEIEQLVEEAWEKGKPTNESPVFRLIPLSPKVNPHELLSGTSLPLPIGIHYHGFDLEKPSINNRKLRDAIRLMQPIDVVVSLFCHRGHYENLAPVDASYRVLQALKLKYGIHFRQCNIDFKKFLTPDSEPETMNITIYAPEEL